MNPQTPLQLADGGYPFVDRRLPLSELQMIEAPAELEKLFREQATRNGMELVRDEPIELRCQSDEFPEATFLVWWPAGSDRIHMLVPRKHVHGQA